MTSYYSNSGSRWVSAQWPYRSAPGIAADVDGDGVPEWVGVWQWQQELFLSVLKHNGRSWEPIATTRGHGDQLETLYAASLADPYRSSIVAGWRDQTGNTRLSVYEWTGRGLADIAPDARPIPVALYPVAVKTASGTHWGYIDDSGRIVIPPQFEYANDFQDNGLAIVQRQGKQGAIDRKGRYVIEPIYDSISPFTDGLASVIDKEGFKVIDDGGHIITPKAYSFIGSYSDGLAVFSSLDASSSSRYGYLDRGGLEKIPAQYLQAEDFKGNRAVVKVNENEYALLDPTGKRLVSYPYAYVGNAGEGLLAYKPKPTTTPPQNQPQQQPAAEKYGYIDESGKVVIPPRFTVALPFRDGRAVVNTAEDYTSKYGLIDRKGSFVIKPEYNDILSLGENRVAVGKAIRPDQPYVGSIYAIADTDGRLLSDFVYYNVMEYNNKGLASVYDNKQTYWIDRSGRPSSQPPRVDGSGTLRFIGSLISANIDLRQYYYDPAGKLVWKPNDIIPLTPPYRIKEIKYRPNKDYLVYYPQIEGMADPAVQESVNAKLRELSGVKPVSGTAQLDSSFTGDFDIRFMQKDLLELELTGYDFPFGAAHGMPTRTNVHLNLKTGDLYALKDLFKPGSPYVQTISGIIREMIRTDPQYDYVFPDSFKEIKPDQPFYVTATTLNIYFAPYEIASYASGFPTFPILYEKLAAIIDRNGRFWQSFH